MACNAAALLTSLAMTVVAANDAFKSKPRGQAAANEIRSLLKAMPPGLNGFGTANLKAGKFSAVRNRGCFNVARAATNETQESYDFCPTSRL